LTQTDLVTLPSGPLVAAFIPEGVGFLVSRRGSIAQQRRFGERITTLLNSNQPATVVWATHSNVWVIEREIGQVSLWPAGNAVHEKLLTRLQRVNGAAISADGSLVALRSGPMPGVTVWEAANGRLLADLPVQRHSDVAFSPDGRWLLTGTDEEYRVWSMTDWQPRFAWASEGSGSEGVIAFSPNARMVAVAQSRNSIQLRPTVDFTETLSVELPGNLSIQGLGWSADGTQLYVQAEQHRLFSLDLVPLRAELARVGLGW
jgi:WD40 repeat protein